jgi:endonuclease/exonuclease/phosphatase family metal-dependent hydrolase
MHTRLVPLTVLTLNLWNDQGPYAERTDLIREWIDRLTPDLIGFNEALRTEAWSQVAQLLEGTAYHLEYVPAQRLGGDREFGNAIASRWPIVDRTSLRLPDAGDGETRAALSISTVAPFGRVSFTSTHLNWRLDHGAIRERQVVALCDFVRQSATGADLPPILVGDFNAEPDSTEIRWVKGLHAIEGRSVAFVDAWAAAGGPGAGHTWCNRNAYARRAVEPDRRIDYVFVGLPDRKKRGIGRIERCIVVCDEEKNGVWASDHFGVLAEIRTEEREGWGPPS